MPTVTIRYTLPDEQGEYNAARQGAEAKRVLWEIDTWCRGLLKHGEPTKEQAELAERIREMIRESPESLLD
jgi:phenylpyruvate tautomerase PptA (4-oxalocrotonate tautomerase family)